MEHQILQAPEMILLGAAGRNLGKTQLALKLIERYKKTGSVIAVKVITVRNHGDICPRGGKGCGICKGLKSCYDVREERGTGQKDTMLFRKAGAEAVYLVRAYPEGLREAMEDVLSRVPEGALVICESNSVRQVVKPGVFLIILGQNGECKPSAREVFSLADFVVEPEESALDAISRQKLLQNYQ